MTDPNTSQNTTRSQLSLTRSMKILLALFASGYFAWLGSIFARVQTRLNKLETLSIDSEAVSVLGLKHIVSIKSLR